MQTAGSSTMARHALILAGARLRSSIDQQDRDVPEKNVDGRRLEDALNKEMSRSDRSRFDARLRGVRLSS